MINIIKILSVVVLVIYTIALCSCGGKTKEKPTQNNNDTINENIITEDILTEDIISE